MIIRVLLSHQTAFEYWRLIGLQGIPVPVPTNAQIPPSYFYEVPQVRAGNISLPIHCIVSKKMRSQANVIYHYASRPLPRGAVYRIKDALGIVSPELALLQIAPTVSVPELAGLMTEFCGFYSPAEFEPFALRSRQPLTSVAALEAFSKKTSYINGLDKFQRALQYAFDRSRSPMETGLALLLSLPPGYGGYSLRGLELNKQIPLKEADRRTFGVQALCPDICWAQEKLCVEYDSADFHADAARVANDAQRKNAFASAGYAVATFTKTQLRSWDKTDLFAGQLAQHLGRRVRGRGYEQCAKLRRELFSNRSVLKNQYGVSLRAGQGVVRLG